jgi:hypothetical protein
MFPVTSALLIRWDGKGCGLWVVEVPPYIGKRKKRRVGGKFGV